jgi:predicted HTH transcriptional regulator
MDPSIRWTHRVTSSSGEWSGNLFDFYYRIINRLTSDLPVPFQLNNNTRVDDTKLHEAVREALLNALVHADYYGRQGTVIVKSLDTLSFANPGDMRVSLKTALEGGVSDPRNTTLMKMFGLIGVGERAGSGVPSIIASFLEAAHHSPTYKIHFSPERVLCTIDLNKETQDGVDKASDKLPINEENSDKFPINEETSDKISDKLQKIIVYMQGNSGVVTQAEIAKMFGVSDRQARNYLSLLLNEGKICAVGANKNRTYTLNI